jgi:peptidoglycan/xylan/chitin deacetylase (PgdA/CDA1 family)
MSVESIWSAVPDAASFAPGPRRFHPTWLHWSSAALHVGAAGAVVAAPPLWPWALGAVAANHAVVAGLSFRPRGQSLGPALTQLPEELAARGALALTFDDGPDPDVTPWLLDELDRCQARATFFCIGERARRYPALAREIVARGHAVENHSYAHSPYSGFWGPRRWRADVTAAQNAIGDATGLVPLFFRPPFGVRPPFLEPALAACGVHCVTWNVRAYDTVAPDAETVFTRLAPQLQAGTIVLLHDGVAVRKRRGGSVLRGALPRVLHTIAQRGLRSINLRAGA